MTTIRPALQPARWLVARDGVIEYEGVTRVGELTGVNPDYAAIHAEGDAAFAGAVADSGVAVPELPSSGWLEAGAVYAYGGAVYVVRQSHNRTEHDPVAVPALFWTRNSTNDWIAGEPVDVGAVRTYGGKQWRCIQAHTTQADWTPPSVPALWAEVVEEPATGEWAAGVAYKVGDEVTYQGVLYRCRQAHTAIVTWEPPNVLALWLPI